MRSEAANTPLDHTLIAIADPTRRAILRRLCAGEARVTDIAAAFPLSLNAVSKHIKLLERARLVERDIRGRDHVLRFRGAPLDEAQAWIERQQAFWRTRLQAIDDLLDEEDRAVPAIKKAKHPRKRKP
jgi:DNA-binding transcriptional ArsR family regulator